MNEHTMNIDDLISQYIDGELAGETEAELHHRLSVSPDDRKRFREQIMLRGIARDPRVLERPTPAMRSELFARLENEEGMTRAAGTTTGTAMAAAAPAHELAHQSASEPHDGASHARTSSAASTLRAGDRRAIGRSTVGRSDRRRRLIPILLPFLIGVIMTGLIWQLNDDDSGLDSGRNQMTSAPEAVGPRVSSGIQSIDSHTTADDENASTEGRDDLMATNEATSTPESTPREERLTDGSSGRGSTSAHGAGASGGSGVSRIASGSDGAGGSLGAVTSPDEFASDPISTRRDYDREPPVEPRSIRRGIAASNVGGLISADRALAAESPVADGAEESTSNSDADDMPNEIAIADAPERKGNDDNGFAESPSTMAAFGEKDVTLRGGRAAEQPKIDNMPMAIVAPPPSVSDKPANGEATSQAKRNSAVAQTSPAPPPAPLKVAESSATTIESTPNKTSISDGVAFADAIYEHPLGWRFTSAAQQSLVVESSSGVVRPELIIRIGADLDEADHEVFAMLGLTAFNQVRSVTTDEYRLDASSNEFLYSSDRTTADELRSELWGGAGYRHNVFRDDNWTVAAGAWGGYGERYMRGGVEIPVAYRLTRNVRVELIPSVQYVKAHGESVTDVRDASVALPASARQQVHEQTEVDDAEVRPGIGVGVVVVME